ncbi:MAG: hypothetical protein JNL58_14560 [Planctomyces sp.]|nr:hypothetical protein [Planctomyces sp.]
MNDRNVSDKQIDEVAYRIRSTPVPDYPSQGLLDSLVTALPEYEQQPMVSRTSAGKKIIAVSCSVVALLLLAVSMVIRSNVVGGSGSVNPITTEVERDVPNGTAELVEPNNVKFGPVQIVTINPTPEFNRMTDQLDLLEARLQILATQVAIQEVRSDAATLLAEYSLRESSVQ